MVAWEREVTGADQGGGSMSDWPGGPEAALVVHGGMVSGRPLSPGWGPASFCKAAMPLPLMKGKPSAKWTFLLLFPLLESAALSEPGALDGWWSWGLHFS